MTLNLASLNKRGPRDPSKCPYLLGELSNLCMDFAAVQDTHFTFAEECQVLEGDFVVFPAFGCRCSEKVSLLVGRSLNAIVNLVFAEDGAGWLWLMLTLKALSSGWSRFMRPIALARDAPFSDFLDCSLTIRNSLFKWVIVMRTLIPSYIRLGGVLVGQICVIAAWSICWPSTIWPTGFVWIIQSGRCGRGYLIRPLARFRFIWIEC